MLLMMMEADIDLSEAGRNKSLVLVWHSRYQRLLATDVSIALFGKKKGLRMRDWQ